MAHFFAACMLEKGRYGFFAETVNRRRISPLKSPIICSNTSQRPLNGFSMFRSRKARALVGFGLTLLLVCAASAQQPPPPPPPPGMGPPPGSNLGPGQGRPFPPPPPPQFAPQFSPPPPAPADANATPGVVVPAISAPSTPAAVTTTTAPPAAAVEKPTWPNEEVVDARASTIADPPPAIERAPIAAPAPTTLVVERVQLPRWLWLLAAACLLLLIAWRTASKKTQVLSDETERLARHQRQLQSAHSNLKSQSEHLRHLAINDPLTGALNRQAFATDLKQVLEHLSKFCRPLNLVLFDMDHFKAINDQLGHLVGDKALKLVVGVVRQHLASEDLFGRFGGDEFLIACADQPMEATAALANQIRLAVVREAAASDPPLTGLSLSIGIAQANPEFGYLPDPLFHRADTALYAAKNAGRNCVVLADDNLAQPPIIGAATRHLA
jgi:diguanylate cyclase (GGDEF)-like protein